LGAILVLLCCCFVDRPVAQFLDDHWFFPPDLLRWPTILSACLWWAAAAAIVVVVVWRIWKPAGRGQTVLLAVSASLIVSTLLKWLLKWGFGRTWPGHPPYDKPSLFAGGRYGFYPFQAAPEFTAFPSGHAATTFSVLAVLWLSYPRWRWLWAIIGIGLCTALVGLNFHFVGDVIAGAMLGSITGVYAAHFFRLPRDNFPPRTS
jgi:membrane-associated phospholipid phosphatase